MLQKRLADFEDFLTEAVLREMQFPLEGPSMIFESGGQRVLFKPIGLERFQADDFSRENIVDRVNQFDAGNCAESDVRGLR
jgi:hypothetical protein